MKKALILLGCPEAPSQTPLAVYAAHKLIEMGYNVMVAGNPSALKLVEVTDPEQHYVKDKTNIDSCLDDIDAGNYQFFLGLIHNDAAVSYFVTFYHILNCPSMALVFHREQNELENFERAIQESTDAKIISARAHHNPTPLRVRLDRALAKLEES